MKRNSKGFTLTELLVTIILLGIVATIIIINMTSISKNSKDREYQQFRESVLSAANAYASQNSDVFSNLYVDKAYMYITTGDVIAGGYLDEKLTNPYTGEIISKTELIKAILDTSSGALKFEYPAESSDKEQYLVALDDYVVFGEPYDCMNGIGTYKLSISDENGNIVTNREELINKYHFTCKYAPGWKEWNDVNDWSKNHGGSNLIKNISYIGEGGTTTSKGKMKYMDEAGTYRITYSFISSSGTPKEFTRNIAVLDTFAPDLEVREVTVAANPLNQARPDISSTTFNNGNKYTNTYGTSSMDTHTTMYRQYEPTTSDCSNYKVLAFRPTLVGADSSNSTYSITRTKYGSANYIANNPVTENLATNSNDFSKIYYVRDGSNMYNIKMTARGHYITNYQLNSEANVLIAQDLVIPNCKISGSSTGAGDIDLKRTITIGDTYSPIGVVRYQTSYDQASYTDLPRNSSGVTSKTFSAISETPVSNCANVANDKQTAYIRPVNAEGFAGPWVAVNVNITNNLYSIIGTNVGTDCNTSCKAGGNSKALGSMNCYYCNKVKTVAYRDKTFTVLGRTSGATVLTDKSKSYNLSGTVVTRTGSWGTQTCDGYYSTSYTYSSTVWNSFKTGIANVDTDIDTCSSDNMFGRATFASDNQGNYTGYSAIPTETDAKLFLNALTPSYWISQSGSSGFTISVHGPSWSTTRYNYYYYVVTGYGANGTITKKAIYTGASYPFRTMHLMNKNSARVCSGDGSDANPYRIASNCN